MSDGLVAPQGREPGPAAPVGSGRPASIPRVTDVTSLLLKALPPLLIAAIATVVYYAAVGSSTGFFFAGVLVATLATPPLVLAERLLLERALTAAAIVDGVSLAWLLALTDPFVTFGDWLRCFVLLLAYVLALWGVTSALARLPAPDVVASALVVLLFVAWLTWPVWLSPWAAGRERMVGWLAAAHPLLALDGSLRHLGPPWTERQLMYNHLSVLNQDVAYELPRSIWPAVVLHTSIGAATLWLSGSLIRPARRAGDPPPPLAGECRGEGEA